MKIKPVPEPCLQIGAKRGFVRDDIFNGLTSTANQIVFVSSANCQLMSSTCYYRLRIMSNGCR